MLPIKAELLPDSKRTTITASEKKNKHNYFSRYHIEVSFTSGIINSDSLFYGTGRKHSLQ